MLPIWNWEHGAPPIVTPAPANHLRAMAAVDPGDLDEQLVQLLRVAQARAPGLVDGLLVARELADELAFETHCLRSDREELAGVLREALRRAQVSAPADVVTFLLEAHHPLAGDIACLARIVRSSHDSG